MFQIQNRSWNEVFPLFTKPVIRGFYSVNKDRQFLPDLSQLKYLKCNIGEKNLDLNEGYEKTVLKCEKPTLESLLKCVIENYDTFKTLKESDKWLQPDFICFRNTLLTFACTPYEKWHEWAFRAVKFRGTIYLCRKLTEKEEEEIANRTEKLKQCLAWGFKFEQYIFSDNPNKPPDTTVPVIQDEEFCCLFSAKLNKHLLLFGAELDGIDSQESIKDLRNLNNSTLVEAKTSKEISHRGELQKFCGKSVKWWCQSFMAGIKKILIGFRNDNGIVKELKYFTLQELRNMSKGYWEPAKCMNCCDEVLTFVKETVKEDQCIYEFSWKPGCNITLRVLNGESENFLPDWFCDEITRIHQTQKRQRFG